MTPGEIVTALIRAAEVRDIDAVCALCSPDIEYDNVPSGKVFGHDGVRKVLSGMTGRADEIDWVVHRQIEQDGTVFNERTDRFRVGEVWIEISLAGLFVVEDGVIVLWRDYFDLATYTRQKEAHLPSNVG